MSDLVPDCTNLERFPHPAVYLPQTWNISITAERSVGRPELSLWGEADVRMGTYALRKVDMVEGAYGRSLLISFVFSL